MTALKALLFAVFGGFIGAAPAAPAIAGPGGAILDAGQTQKSERPTCGASGRSDASVAGAPPFAGDVAATTPPTETDRPPAVFAASILVLCGRTVPPPLEDVRAGLLDLPPPAR